MDNLEDITKQFKSVYQCDMAYFEEATKNGENIPSKRYYMDIIDNNGVNVDMDQYRPCYSQDEAMGKDVCGVRRVMYYNVECCTTISNMHLRLILD